MIAPDLPAELRAALQRKAEGLSRSDAADRAAAISQTYRGGGGSGAIRGEPDALAYALTRMPATYAAVVASVNALREIRPEFAPESLLDVGAGPCTATWAAAQAFDSLNEFAAIDANPVLRRSRSTSQPIRRGCAASAMLKTKHRPGFATPRAPTLSSRAMSSAK